VATIVLLARHGETDWNLQRRWQGHADPPLNDRGREQARQLAAHLADVDLEAIYASDLARARETAWIVAAAKGVDGVVTDSALREIDVGEWSGLTTTEIERHFPDGLRRHADGGDGWVHGESHRAMSERIVGAVTRIAAAHAGGCVLCVLHGGVMRAILAHAAGRELGEFRRAVAGPVNGAVARIAVEGSTFRRRD
jgi:broad specificity phosphatase PhoE